jgi:hypothetical protein
MSNQDTQDRFPTIGGRPFGRRAGSARCGAAHHDQRLERLIERLPDRWQKFVRQLRRPSARWARIPAGILLVVAGCLAILPIFGLWMIPLGLFLLAEDVQLLRRLRERLLDWLERRWPHLFAHSHKPAADKEETT